ncbi:hypothetical protein [Nisaea sediminum]|uniref:hypothetical protein n=1 Tax=Nisaea sediminum TaxID=2775867 RepID=UPI001868F51F|nr:hypothetical protein [Nisaea sediminum]
MEKIFVFLFVVPTALMMIYTGVRYFWAIYRFNKAHAQYGDRIGYFSRKGRTEKAKQYFEQRLNKIIDRAQVFNLIFLAAFAVLIAISALVSRFVK